MAGRLKAASATGLLTGQGGDAVFFQAPDPRVVVERRRRRRRRRRRGWRGLEPGYWAEVGRWTRHSVWTVARLALGPSPSPGGGRHPWLDAFDRGDLDVAIIRRDEDRRDGETLGPEHFGWFASPNFEHRAGEPLRLAALLPECGVRDLATRALDQVGMDWAEVFVGGSSAVEAAVAAGLATSVFSRRLAPTGTVDVGARFGFPPLPSSEIVLHSTLTDPKSKAALRTIVCAFRKHRPN